jgi:hypothetical protein
VVSRRRAIILIAIVAVASACYVDFTSNDDHYGGGSNTPAVGLSSTGMGYAVRAKNFSSDEKYGPTVQTRFVSVGSTVVGYSGGSATIEVRDATSKIVFEERITNNVTQGSSVGTGVPPFEVLLTFRHFSGSFTLAVGPGDGR